MEIPCIFTIGKTEYICQPTGYKAIILPNALKMSFKGFHPRNKSNQDVDYLFCYLKRMSYLPAGLNAHFPKLTSLKIEGCGLKEISRLDLFGLENLERLNLRSNCLSMLPDDLFHDSTKIKRLDFSCNNITRVSSKLFLLLDDLQEVYFLNNPSIHYSYIKDEFNTIKSLMKHIDENCEPPFKMFSESHSKVLGKLLETGKLSDFTIKVGTDGIFKVHKLILAVQSPMFEAMFDNKMQENASGEMIISDFCEAAVADFLFFIYNGVVRRFSNAMELYALADKYQVPALKEISENIIEINLDESNALVIFNFGHLYDCDRLKRSALKEIGEFLEEDLSDDFLNLPATLQQLITARKEMLKQQRQIRDLLVVPNKRMRPNPSS